jgi:CheY-like chemotaxis protein
MQLRCAWGAGALQMKRPRRRRHERGMCGSANSVMAAPRAARTCRETMPTVVVIEEDSAMRTLICEWLLGEGYAVRALPAQGIASSPHGGSEADLVIVDVPDLRDGGADTVRAVRAGYPRAALIGLSTRLGRSLHSDSNPARALGLRRLVAKPCARGELLQAVADTIGAAH